jgi:glycosidase
MDFTLHDAYMQAFNEVEQGWDKGMLRFYENFVNDFLYKEPNNLLVFFENHDTQRFNELYPKFEDYKLATTLLATTRGIPQIYYGSEIGMKGDKSKGDADIRRDFPGGWPGDSNNAFTDKGRTAEQKLYFDWTKKLLNWRKTKSAIHHGKLIQFIPQNNVYVYFRQHDSETIMVVLNNSPKEEKIEFDRFKEVMNGFAFANAIFEGENLDLKSMKTLTIPSKSVRIYEMRK